MGLLYKFFQLFLKFCLQYGEILYRLLSIDLDLIVGSFQVVW